MLPDVVLRTFTTFNEILLERLVYSQRLHGEALGHDRKSLT
jgi:hypothetical protein